MPAATAGLGDCSYSVYLWHTFAISVMLKVAVLVGFASGATMAAMTLAGVLIGVACYELCERPLTRLLHGRRSGERPLRRVNPRAAAGS